MNEPVPTTATLPTASLAAVAATGGEPGTPTRSVRERFSIATPGDWIELPLDPRNRDRRIARLVEERMGKQDELAHLRHRTTLRLRKHAAEAAAAGAFFVAMQGRVAGGRPMSASIVISLTRALKSRDGDVLDSAEELEAALASSDEKRDVLEHSVVELPLGRAARIRARSGSGEHGVDGREVMSESVQFYLPQVDEKSRTLALVFSTPIMPLADPYAELFDAMAGTARWA